MRNRVFILMIVAVFMLVSPAFALLDAIYDDSTNVQQGINDSGNSSVNRSGNSDNRNTNLLNNNQGQDQNQGQKQAQGQANKIAIDDNSDYEAYAFSPPAIHAQKGTESGNMYSIFGGVGLSTTEDYTVAIEKLATIERMLGAGFMTEEEALVEAKQTYKELDEASQPKRWLGIFGQTRGRSLLNVFGLLSWDSWYKEGQTPFSKSAPWAVREKKEIVPDVNDGSGNEGYVN